MFRYHAKSLCRDLYAALRRKGPWYEVRYHALSLWSDFIHPARCLVYGCRNLYAYFPLIWHDRDWDYSCMLTLWELKFARMAELHTKYGSLMRSPETASQLRQAVWLCHRIRVDEYDDVNMAAHDKKWGEAEHVWLSTGHRTSEMRSVRLHVRNDEDDKNERREFMQIIRAGEKQKANDIAYLTTLIRKHLLTWWD